jgi:Na+-transporting NADH:ubiquinone oxidoreductase subunit C
MDRNGNTYTLMYASILVIIAAAILSTVAMLLQTRQAKNFEIEKKQNILASVHIESTVHNAEALYAKKIVNTYIIDIHGNIKTGNAFEVDLKKEQAKPAKEQDLPVFECHINEEIKYIIPLRGAGLWGPIWGYIALNKDCNTIYGVNFSHKSETPGLGAEINTQRFQHLFQGKKIFNNSEELVSIAVAKTNESAPAVHRVDAISGGTITSKGLEQMLREGLGAYQNFFNKKRAYNMLHIRNDSTMRAPCDTTLKNNNFFK